ncbi:MAG: DUF393 domain-containing protein [Candidatus Hydrogenedentota bacterium]|nr:MAG: DUF393 domain-containing protein [Candidatus Hydrogenedentota bacterium]
MEQRTPKEGRVPVAVYDGRCGLCRNFAALLRKQIPLEDLDVVPCGSPLQKKLAPEANEACRTSFVIVEPDGRVLSGGDAAARAVAMAPRLKPFRWMIDSRAGRSVARRVYRGTQWLRRRRRCCE